MSEGAENCAKRSAPPPGAPGLALTADKEQKKNNSAKDCNTGPQMRASLVGSRLNPMPIRVGNPSSKENRINLLETVTLERIAPRSVRELGRMYA